MPLYVCICRCLLSSDRISMIRRFLYGELKARGVRYTFAVTGTGAWPPPYVPYTVTTPMQTTRIVKYNALKLHTKFILLILYYVTIIY